MRHQPILSGKAPKVSSILLTGFSHPTNGRNRAGQPMIKAAFCDIDGTLLDSNWLHAAAWKDALAAAGIDVGLEDVRRQIGKGGDEPLPGFVPWWKIV